MNYRIKKNIILPSVVISSFLLLGTSCKGGNTSVSDHKPINKVQAVDNSGEQGKLSGNDDKKKEKQDKSVDKSEKDKQENDLADFIDKSNDFSYKTFAKIFNSEKNFISSGKSDNISGKNIVYSPFSYESALKMLLNLSDNGKADENISFLDNYPLKDYKFNNITTGTKAIVNKNFAKVNPVDKDIVNAEFPKEATNIVEDLQKNILNSVIYKPNYNEQQEVSIVNATRFFGKWKDSFDKANTISELFTKINGDTLYADTMNQTLNNYPALETENYDVIYKGIVDEKTLDDNKQPIETGGVYIVVPKFKDTYKQADKEKIVGNIIKYMKPILEKYDKDSQMYSKIYLKLPKLNTKTELKLKNIENNNKTPFVNFKYLLKKSITPDNDKELSISDISQVCTLKIDEETVEAKAVTGIEMTRTMIPTDTLEIDARKPHFLVIISNNDGKELITFMSYISEPENTK